MASIIRARGIHPLLPIDILADEGAAAQSLKPYEALHYRGCGCGCAEGGVGQWSGNGGINYAPDLVPGDASSTAAVAVGGSVIVTIDTAGDRDWYRVTLEAGKFYTIQTSYNGSGADAFLNLRDSTGTLISSNDDSGEGYNALISFGAPTTGTYYIDAGTFNNLTAGTFNLFVAEVNLPPGDSVGATVETAATLAIGGTINGRIEYFNDHDFYAVNLIAGQTYLFRTAPMHVSSTVDTVLSLRDGAGVQLAFNGDTVEAGFSAIRYTATSTGTYYLDVSSFSESTGTFNLTAFNVPTPSLLNNDQIATQLTHGYWDGQSRRWDITTGGTITVNLTALTVAGRDLAREALALWTDASGIQFNEVTTGGQIVFDDNAAGAFATMTHANGISALHRSMSRRPGSPFTGQAPTAIPFRHMSTRSAMRWGWAMPATIMGSPNM